MQADFDKANEQLMKAKMYQSDKINQLKKVGGLLDAKNESLKAQIAKMKKDIDKNKAKIKSLMALLDKIENEIENKDL